MNVFWFILPGAAAAALAATLTPVVRRLAVRVGAVDYPGPRKVHDTPTARLGGLAVVGSIVIVLALAFFFASDRVHNLAGSLLGGLALGALPILAISLRDDIRPLPAIPKFAAHFLGAVIAVSAGIVLGPVVHVFGQDVTIGWLAIPLSILWLMGLTSAFNIIDGLDGLSAGLAFISSASLAIVSLVNGALEMAAAASILAGALAGFLPYNVNPAKIYLGDTGATAIGFMLGCLALGGGSRGSAGLAVALPLLVVGVPIADTLLAMARRAVRRLGGDRTAGIFIADADHIHHRLLALGYTHRRAVALLYVVGIVLALTGLASLFLSYQKAAVLLVTILIACVIGVGKLGYDEFAVFRRGQLLRVYEVPALKTGLFTVFFDIAMVAVSIWLAIGLKYDDWNLDHHRVAAAQLLALLPACTIGTFAVMRIYRDSWRNAGVDDMVKLAAAIVIAGGAALFVNAIAIERPVSISLVVMATVLFLVVGGGIRASYRVLYQMHRRASRDGEPVVIYGAGKAGVLALREIITNEAVLMRPVAFLDDDDSLRGKYVHGLPVMGTFADVSAVMEKTGAKGLVIASPKIPITKDAQVVEMCRPTGAWVRRFQIGFDDTARA
ncbi:MAG: hypothetical protein ACRD2J_17100 [Thermoanaerobaculia bacterium]